MKEFRIDPDIRRAWTLPSEVYREETYWEAQRRRVFPRSWQLLPGLAAPSAPGEVVPFTLLEGCLDEPLVLTRDRGGRLRALSNVCTHRGNLVVEEPGRVRGLRCRYHGRRFDLDGRFASMPEFDGVEGFPSPGDDLAPVPVETWGPLVFTALDPARPFDELIEPVRRRVGWLPLDRLRPDPATSRDYEVRANWALYCDNFLEGFHIPFVHPGLAAEVEYGSYRTETFSRSSLQIAIAERGEAAFELPATHPDGGERIAAYYFWLFPNAMLNFYPWGLSVNVVLPQGRERTRVAFVSYVLDESRRSKGAGADLHRVELEDEEVVENVQRGIRSRIYRRGRYSPSRETGVHHFHRLLAEALFPPGT